MCIHMLSVHASMCSLFRCTHLYALSSQTSMYSLIRIYPALS